jgi:parallel beta-helix repeat protein
MKYVLLRKCLVVGTIMLIIGVSITLNSDNKSSTVKPIRVIVDPIVESDPNSEWEKVYIHNGSQDGRGVCVALNGTEYVAAGISYSSQIKPFLLKVNSQGQKLFYHDEYGPWSYYDAAFCLTPTSDGGFVMGGKTQHIPGKYYDNILVFKTDTNGTLLWNHEYDILYSDYFDRMWDIVELSDGNLVGCGTISQEPTYFDAGLIKMNSQGEKLWHQFYGQAGTTETARALTKTSDGGFLIAGYYGWDRDEENMKSKLYVVKTDANGNEEWSRTFGDANVWNVANWVGETPCGNYMVAGRTGEEKYGTNGWVLKLTPFGEIIWERVIGGNYNDWFIDGFINDSGNCILVGLTQSYSSDPGISENNRDGWTISIHSEGHTLWEKIYGGSGSRDQFMGIDGPTADNRYIAGGSSNWDPYMVKFAPPQNRIVNIDTGESFESIQDAIDAANTGNTLSVLRGTYRENVTINKSLTLIGESKDNTIIDGRSSGDVVAITADGVSIRRFTIQNCEVSFGPLYAGIKIDSNNNAVDNNNIQDCHNGVYLYPGTTGNVVSNNTITNDRWCFTGILLYESSGNKIYSNDITNSLGQGSGIFLELSSNNAIYANTIHDNHQGIYMTRSSNDNIFHHNNFIDNINYNAYIENSIDTCTGNQWYFQYPSCGNYWSDFTGPDSNDDGIIDTPPAPYYIPGGIGDQDLHPLVDQWIPVCGNVNGDPKGNITIGDISYLIDYLIIEPIGEPEPVPPCAADVDGDGDVTQFDIEYLIAYLFITGQEPVPNCCCK